MICERCAEAADAIAAARPDPVKMRLAADGHTPCKGCTCQCQVRMTSPTEGTT